MSSQRSAGFSAGVAPSGPKKRRGSYRCKKCGQPKKGHTCTWKTPPKVTSACQAELDPDMTVRQAKAEAEQERQRARAASAPNRLAAALPAVAEGIMSTLPSGAAASTRPHPIAGDAAGAASQHGPRRRRSHARRSSGSSIPSASAAAAGGADIASGSGVRKRLRPGTSLSEHMHEADAAAADPSHFPVVKPPPLGGATRMYAGAFAAGVADAVAAEVVPYREAGEDVSPRACRAAAGLGEGGKEEDEGTSSSDEDAGDYREDEDEDEEGEDEVEEGCGTRARVRRGSSSTTSSIPGAGGSVKFRVLYARSTAVRAVEEEAARAAEGPVRAPDDAADTFELAVPPEPARDPGLVEAMLASGVVQPTHERRFSSPAGIAYIPGAAHARVVTRSGQAGVGVAVAGAAGPGCRHRHRRTVSDGVPDLMWARSMAQAASDVEQMRIAGTPMTTDQS